MVERVASCCFLLNFCLNLKIDWKCREKYAGSASMTLFVGEK